MPEGLSQGPSTRIQTCSSTQKRRCQGELLLQPYQKVAQLLFMSVMKYILISVYILISAC